MEKRQAINVHRRNNKWHQRKYFYAYKQIIKFIMDLSHLIIIHYTFQALKINESSEQEK